MVIVAALVQLEVNVEFGRTTPSVLQLAEPPDEDEVSVLVE